MRPRRRSTSRIPAAVLALPLLLAPACAPLPHDGPPLATDRGAGRGGDAGPAGGGPAGPPGWEAPRNDLAWGGCSAGSVPEATLECTELDSDIGDGKGEVTLGLTRVTSPETPDDAPPLVVVAGPEADSEDLAARVARAGDGLLEKHPVVVLDHRGRWTSADECLGGPDRDALHGLGTRGVDPASGDVRADLTRGTIACLDVLETVELDFGAAGAARDLETLRTHWDVPGLAVLGLGEGTRTATRFAADHPDRVSKLVLDSPVPPTGEEEESARVATEGTDAALRQWASACRRAECGGADATDRVDGVRRALDTARAPGGDVAPYLLLAILRSALADLSGVADREASDGDRILGELASGAPGPRTRARADELAEHSLPWIARCSDLHARVAVARIAELDTEWTSSAPVSGPLTAAGLAACSTWPVPPESTVSVPADLPVLVASSAADPYAGPGAAEPVAAALRGAGARSTPTVTWHSPGSRTVLHSRCVRDAVVGFLADPASSPPSTACPA